MSDVAWSIPSWMPSHYQELSRVSLLHAASEGVTPMCWGMSITPRPEPHVKHLSSAAAKYRLAYLCTGLKGPDPATVSENIGAEYFDKYSAQAIVMLSYVAFETHLRMLNVKRNEYQIGRTGVDYKPIAASLRDEFEKGDFDKLVKAMDHHQLKERLKKFNDGSDGEVLAVLSAIRNSFSHGKMGVTNSVGLECAKGIKDYLLEVIKADAMLMARSMKDQDTSLLS